MWDNETMHVSDLNSESQSTFTSIGVECILLTNHSPELNPEELAFNAVTQYFRDRHYESVRNANNDALDFQHGVINLIIPDIVVSCYQTCGCTNCF